MSRRSPQFLTRWATLLALGWLLLAGQQITLLHPLAHPQIAAHPHGDPQAPESDGLGCALCLGCAAAADLADAAPAAMPVLRETAAPARSLAIAAAPSRLPSTRHNRGPPETV